jgi:hypothetical protein
MKKLMAFALIAGVLAGPVIAAEVPAASPDGAKRFATVMRIRGDVAATGPDSAKDKERKLRVGDVVYVGENVRASSMGEAVLKTDDAGLVAVRPRSEFIAERFQAEDKPTDSFTLRLVSGSLRVISGWIARTNRAGHTVVTNTATVGIRGTDHEPYVLSAEMALATNNKEGTYDKVNRGGTTLQVGEEKLDIDAGKVGFARATKSGVKLRGLLTLLMPVLLDKVPSFYVPGEFDAELDRLSAAAEQESLRQLELRRQGGAGAAPAAPVDCTASAKAATKTWLAQFDGAIVRKDPVAIMALFAADAQVRATVRTNEGATASLDLDREELAQSTVAALKGLKDYRQRRISVDGKPANAEGATTCTRVAVSSVAIEQGSQSGKPYRLESLEEYVLELRAGKWLAVSAATTQK